MSRPTFKKQARTTGLAGVAYPYPATDIKVAGKVVGSITPPSYQQDTWRVMLIVERPSDTESCQWGWITLKGQFETEPQAREFVVSRWPTITEKYRLFPLDREED